MTALSILESEMIFVNNYENCIKKNTFDCGVFISDVSTSGQENGAAMSATIVRKKAVEFFNKHHNGKNLKHWIWIHWM